MVLGLEDVLGDIDQHGAGTPGRGDIERLMHNLRQIGDILHQEIMLGAGARYAERVRFLKCIAADELGGNLAGESDNRYRVHHGVDQTGDEVRRAGSGCRATDADSSRGARVAFGGETGVLLVPHQDVADLVIIQRVVEGERNAAGISENAIDILADQALEQNLSAAHEFRLVGGSRPGCSCVGHSFISVEDSFLYRS